MKKGPGIKLYHFMACMHVRRMIVAHVEIVCLLVEDIHFMEHRVAYLYIILYCLVELLVDAATICICNDSSILFS